MHVVFYSMFTELNLDSVNMTAFSLFNDLPEWLSAPLRDSMRTCCTYDVSEESNGNIKRAGDS